MPRLIRTKIHSKRDDRRGFTLVEMLVTLALTMIMMLCFAQIFQITGNFVARQKGLAENDQSARIVTTILKTDLQNRTMRLLAPFHPNMSSLSDDNTNRLGYFYYSENNPMDEADDVLQFTVKVPLTNPFTLSPSQPLFGRGTFIPSTWQGNTAYGGTNQPSYVQPPTPNGFIYAATTAGTSAGTQPTWPTTAGGTVGDGSVTWTCVDSSVQPDGDDGVLYYFAAGQNPSVMNPTTTPPVTPNNTGASQYAEVTYFLRHGSLYRRVLMIREPYNTTTGTSQPGTTAVPMITGLYTPAIYPSTAGATTGNFWTDFDYSARIVPQNPGTAPTGVSFLGVSSGGSSLSNYPTGANQIGRPDNRFGFDQTYDVAPADIGPLANGTPREYALPYNSGANTIVGGGGATPVFFGRYTHEETSNASFLFPGALPQVGGAYTSPLGWASTLGLDTTSYTMFLLNANPPTANVPFAGGPRRGEDILLTNVVSFDVKLWDNNYSEAAAGWDVNRNGIIDSGAAFADVGHLASGDFQQSKNIFPVYGPVVSTAADSFPGNGVWAPPYTYTDPNSGLTLNHNNLFDTWYRQFNYDNLTGLTPQGRTYDAADSGSPNGLNAPAPYRPRVGNTYVLNKAYAVGTTVDPINTANGYTYKCTAITGTGTSGAAAWAASTAYASLGKAQPTTPNGLVYLAVPPGGTSGTAQPAWPTTIGNTVVDGTVTWMAAADPFTLSDVVGTTIIDGGVTWTVQPPVAVQAIQIRVKYLDPTQNLLRQVTIVQQLLQ